MKAESDNVLPIRSGGLDIYPALGVRASYVSNIFAKNDNETDDFIVEFAPQLTIKKHIRDHAFNISGTANIFRYKDNASENIEDWEGAFFGHLTATSRLKIPFQLSHKIDHVQRNQDRVGATPNKPIGRKTSLALLGFDWKPNRLNIKHNFSYKRTRFDNGTSAVGAPIVRDDGDNKVYGFKTDIEYLTRANWSPFIGLSLERSEFLRPSGGIERDNYNVSGLMGVRYQYKGLYQAELAMGQGRILYDHNTLEDVGAFSLSGSLKWSPRENTTLQANIFREAQENSTVNLGLVTTAGGVELNHMVKRDMLLSLFGDIEEDDYDIGLRKDKIYQAGLGLRYDMSQKFSLEGRYSHSVRNSNDNDLDYDQNIFMLFLNSKL